MSAKTTALLILTHKPLPYLGMLLAKAPSLRVYIHIDAKANAEEIMKPLAEYANQIQYITPRINIRWAGFSMVEATLLLIQAALASPENQYFHLISGDDVLLKPIDQIVNSWNKINPNTIFLASKKSIDHRYRLRFNAPHADTPYQRSPFGKALTITLKILDKLIPSQKHTPDMFGSQWFSIQRPQLDLLLESISEQDRLFFRKKLCPDEHFFQYIIARTPSLKILLASENKRYIIFDRNQNRGASPIFLSLDQLKVAQKQGAWFARKIDATLAKDALSLIYKENE